MRILIAEDDAPLADFLLQGLKQEQFTVQLATDGAEAQRLAADQSFDLVLLDLNRRGVMAFEVMRSILAKKPDLPVMIVSGAGPAEERVKGLNAGADDCLAKPFAFAELVARIRAVLRRKGASGQSLLKVEDLELDRFSHMVQRSGQLIELSPKEYALLEFLMRHAGQPVSRAAIVEQVWKLNFDTMTNIVDVYVNYLRRKIDAGHERMLIRTVRGTGYQIGTSFSTAARGNPGVAADSATTVLTH
jgi:DNA-binding response OmpR family regulator